jgi:tRNA (mo5U34)-methyltransferase
MPSYSVSEIKRKIKSLEGEIGWYQCIDLENGIKTKTRSHWGEPLNYPLPKWNLIKNYIPESLEGMRVLDIGCNAGFFCIEAKRRHADYVLGIDESPGYLKQAAFVADVLNLEIDYKRMNIYELSEMNTKFDLVLALGIIYHCKHPLMAAENIANVCDGTAIIESQLIEKPIFILEKPLTLIKDILKGRFFKRKLPIWTYVYEGYRDPSLNKDKKEEDYNWWFPNMDALIKLFMTVGFTKIEKLHGKNRGSIICYK